MEGNSFIVSPSSSSNTNGTTQMYSTTYSQDSTEGDRNNKERKQENDVLQEESTNDNDHRVVDHPFVGCHMTNPEELPWWFPKYRGTPIFYGNPEALGWCLEAIGRAIAVISAAAFLGTPFLNKVKGDAGCSIDAELDEDGNIVSVPECHADVYGIRPSSILAMYTIVMGVSSSVVMPFAGAITDYTKHRRLLGRWTSFFICLLLLPTIFIDFLPWEVLAVSFVCMSFAAWIETVVSNAYLPELTDDEEILNYFMKMFVALPFLAVICFLMSVLGVAYVWGITDDDIALCELAQSASLVASIVFLGIAWGIFLQCRPPVNTVRPGKTLWVEGLTQIYGTCLKIHRHYSALKWFYVSLAFGEAGLLGFGTIAVTFQTDKLLFSSTQTGIAFFLGMVATVPGAFIGSFFAKVFNPIYSSIMSVILIIVVTSLYALIVDGPGKQFHVYGLLFGYGLSSGWKWTCDKMLASSLIPDGQDAELMGFFSCFGNILTWLPPVIFTVMNENHLSERLGIAILNIYFVIAIIAYFFMGSYRDALAVAGRIRSSSPAKVTEKEKQEEEEGELEQFRQQDEENDQKNNVVLESESVGFVLENSEIEVTKEDA